MQEAISRPFTLPFFTLPGMLLPWGEWLSQVWSARALVRRWLAALHHRADTLFFGWFGLSGVAAVLYALRVQRETDTDLYWTVGTLIVTTSLQPFPTGVIVCTGTEAQHTAPLQKIHDG